MGTAGPSIIHAPHEFTDFHHVVAPESVESRKILFLGNKIILFLASCLENLFLKCGSTAPLSFSKGSCAKC